MKKLLPENTIGRAGRDIVSHLKDLTIIMIPFERFSPFTKIVDDLYKTVDVPFNLILMEGNAPESVRSSLEKLQKHHHNITMIYSDHQLSTGGAINLAIPHIKTKYVFVMDNDVRMPSGAMSALLRRAQENQHGIVWPQNYVVCPREGSPTEKTGNKTSSQSLGMRTCFLISQNTLNKFGKFDEGMTPFTMGIDLRMTAEEMNISICHETSTRMELDGGSPSWDIDSSLHSFQWNQERAHRSFENLQKKWGILLPTQKYTEWLEDKNRGREESKNIFFFIMDLFFHFTSSPQKKELKKIQDFSLPNAA